jgi:hypothetical protein
MLSSSTWSLFDPLFSRPDEILVEFEPVGVAWFFPPLREPPFPLLLFVDCTFVSSFVRRDCEVLLLIDGGAWICLMGEVLPLLVRFCADIVWLIFVETCYTVLLWGALEESVAPVGGLLPSRVP